jgi:uncharacterized membrane-anchored protein
VNSVATVVVVAVAQLACVGAAVAPQLSSRLTGEDYRMEVRPVDPIDPFRGAYVTLDYPGLSPLDGAAADGDVFVPLVEEDGLWVAASVTHERPDSGPYLAGEDRGWETDCGIGSWFADQQRAEELEQSMIDDGGVATVRIDDRGSATVVDVR